MGQWEDNSWQPACIFVEISQPAICNPWVQNQSQFSWVYGPHIIPRVSGTIHLDKYFEVPRLGEPIGTVFFDRRFPLAIWYLGGGVKYFLFSTLLGEDSHFDDHIFLVGVGEKPPTRIRSCDCLYYWAVWLYDSEKATISSSLWMHLPGKLTYPKHPFVCPEISGLHLHSYSNKDGIGTRRILF